MDVGQVQVFTATTSGGSGSLSYQWYYTNGTSIAGAATSNLTYKANSTGTYNIYLNVTDNLGFKTQSNTATINVYSQPSVIINPNSVNMSVGSPNQFVSSRAGGLVPYSYQWYLNDTAVQGATAAAWTFMPTSVGAYNIYLNVTDNNNVTVKSNTATATVYDPAVKAFDFGTATSPVQSGYTQVTESTIYSANLGYGWISTTGLDSRDRGAPDNLTRDFVFSPTPHTFNVDLANGNYQITVVIGDQNYMHDQIYVYAQNVLEVNNLTVAAGSFQRTTFTTTITNGQLNLTIQDGGGLDPNWLINALTITVPITVSYPTQVSFDFGTPSSPVQSGYAQVTESTLYSANLGYGWISTTGLGSRDSFQEYFFLILFRI